MTTDTAVLVTKLVVEDKRRCSIRTSELIAGRTAGRDRLRRQADATVLPERIR